MTDQERAAFVARAELLMTELGPATFCRFFENNIAKMEDQAFND
jgi:hypothetical protein